jgi:cysteine desulfurase/selenocysteine lyase
MIEYVTREDATWAELPHKFEAGTVNAADAAGLKAAIECYKQYGFDEIVKREETLGEYAFSVLKSVPHLKILGADEAAAHHGIFSFVLEGVHPHDIAEILNADGVCIRAGHHCAQVLMKTLGVPSTVRASLSFYNTEEEIDRLGESLRTVRRRMGYAE